jgi:hypothetical protein
MLQGNLRDFSATEILQLLGTQKKTGCLTLERESGRMSVHVLDGRVVSTRLPGLTKDDPLLAFLRVAHRLSDEQMRGILTIQHESERDLEDLLLNGRYLDAEELATFVERQILDDLMKLANWDDGTYRFDPHQRWPRPPLSRLSIEAVLMEVARRADEIKRCHDTFPDPRQIPGVRDLPAPDAELGEDERELFGIVDGRRTLEEVVAAAPLSEYETYEALQRMLEAGWIEIVGRGGDRPLTAPAPAPTAPSAAAARSLWTRELAVAAAVVLSIVLLRVASHALDGVAASGSGPDVYAAAQMRDVRLALDLYRRERGAWPARLEDLVEDRWLADDQLRLPGGGRIHYAVLQDGTVRLAAQR